MSTRIHTILALLVMGAVAVSSSAKSYIRYDLSENNLFPGLPTLCSVMLYTTDDNIAGVNTAHRPTFEGFEMRQLNSQAKYCGETKIKGTRYNIVRVALYMLTPKHVHKARISDGEYLLYTTEEGANRAFDPFDPFGMFYRPKTITTPLSASNLTVKIHKMPGAPSGFCGALGEMEIVSFFPSEDFVVDEPCEAIVRISGYGSTEKLSIPDLNRYFGAGITLNSVEELSNETVIKSEKDNTTRLWSRAEIKITFTPHSTGTQNFPGLEFIYFDTKSGKYRKKITSPMGFEVKRSATSKSKSKEYYV